MCFMCRLPMLRETAKLDDGINMGGARNIDSRGVTSRDNFRGITFFDGPDPHCFGLSGSGSMGLKVCGLRGSGFLGFAVSWFAV